MPEMLHPSSVRRGALRSRRGLRDNYAALTAAPGHWRCSRSPGNFCPPSTCWGFRGVTARHDRRPGRRRSLAQRKYPVGSADRGVEHVRNNLQSFNRYFQSMRVSNSQGRPVVRAKVTIHYPLTFSWKICRGSRDFIGIWPIRFLELFCGRHNLRRWVGFQWQRMQICATPRL